MDDPIKSFGGVATGLARNPLGIIALFIVLVYGFASLTTAFGGDFEPRERLVLVWFMVIFPVLVLGVFSWLVSRHSDALFGPLDYVDEKNYIRMLELRQARLGALSAELNTRTLSIMTQAEQHPARITEEQRESAIEVEVQVKDLDKATLRAQLQQLALEYETIRSRLRAGQDRTRAMTAVLVKMRTLARAVSGFLDELKASDTPGDRLAAVAIMQILPEKADIGWLLERFRVEKPFIFYQASAALLIVARQGSGRLAREAAAAAREAIRILERDSRTPDSNTLEVLAAITELADPI